MKKPKPIKRLKKVKLHKVVKRPVEGVRTQISKRRGKTAEEKVDEAISTVPRITNETVEEHREEVLSSARKYIYPLEHSKHSIVRITLAILGVVVISFFVITTLSLYKFQSTGGFMYDVTRIIPFPVAKAGNSWVSYESYLFELRRNMHYYQTQQDANFNTKDGKEQLQRLKKQAMSQAVQDAYVKQLAAENDVSVSNKQVETQLELVREQNRLGSNDRVFKDVLNEFWGWDESDFKRVLKQQLLKQAVVAELDSSTRQRANDALSRLNSGEDFAKVASEVSDDVTTKAAGGAFPTAITANTREVPPILTAALLKLQPGQISGIINPGYTLEIVKVNENNAGSIKAAHIQFNLKDITVFVKPYQAKHTSNQFIRF